MTNAEIICSIAATIALTPCGLCPKGTDNCGNKRCNDAYRQEAEDVFRDFVEPHRHKVIELESKVARLEKEANWLATQLANALIDPGFIAHLDDLVPGLMHPPTPEIIRDAARETVEKEDAIPCD